MLAMRRVFVVALTLAILVLASVPASAAERRAFVSPQVALDWNLNAVNVVRAFRSATTPPAAYFQTEGLIYMSYVQAAVYDAVMKISGRYVPYHSFPANTQGASAEAAVIEATYRVLINYQGDVVVAGTTLTSKYNAALAALPDAGKAEGMAVGAAAATDIIALRSTDGRDGVGTNCPYVAQPVAAGVWQAPSNGAQTPWVACMTPFLLRNAAQFRIGPPPSLLSTRYATDFNETKAYGGASSTVRTAEQRATGFFWTLNVINQHNQALRTTATQRGMDLVDTVRLLAMGEMVITDSAIACFDSKYHYLFWRPYVSIPGAGTDNNPETVPDASWTPVGGATPNHPEYPSAHACVTSALALTVAKAVHTRRINVTIPGAIEGVPTATTTRTFATVNDVTSQIMDARVWIGFHYRFSDVRGVQLGTNVARWTLNRYFRPSRGGNDDNGDGDNNDGNDD